MLSVTATLNVGLAILGPEIAIFGCTWLCMAPYCNNSIAASHLDVGMVRDRYETMRMIESYSHPISSIFYYLVIFVLCSIILAMGAN